MSEQKSIDGPNEDIAGQVERQTERLANALLREATQRAKVERLRADVRAAISNVRDNIGAGARGVGMMMERDAARPFLDAVEDAVEDVFAGMEAGTHD